MVDTVLQSLAEHGENCRSNVLNFPVSYGNVLTKTFKCRFVF